ncbi:hypothetical protein GCM10023085_76200 [Actinomadura viridis]|uniref:DUF4184 family protein n=1 Tax=Actinomadura viridis TaxID=58110 RepID=A0A931GMZ0_9ACTN|nr:DUF4184 family protein [Actinomadura viridis]MBG6088971.1 hypothetical protein [Actinomadura viridis]
MPFTLSHPAAVLPLARGRLVPSALVAGSMAPDVPYFFSMGDLRAATHDPVGIVTVDIVLGLALFAAFHLVWKWPLVALAPGWARRRLAGPAAGFRWSRIGWVPPSILAGAVTHVLWDAFTHRYHGFADLLPWLVTITFAGLELFRWLQYGSGLLGIAVIAWWSWRWARRAPAPPETRRALPVRGAAAVWGVLVGCAVTGGLLGAATLINQPDLPRTVHMTLASGVIGAICGGGGALTVFGLAFAAFGVRGGVPDAPGAVDEGGRSPAPTADADRPANV